MAMEHEAFEDVFPINIWVWFHCHGWFTGGYLNSLLLAQPLRNLITIKNKTKKNMPGKQPLHKFIPHQLETPKTQPFTVAFQKMVRIPMFSRHAQETLELKKSSGISRHRFSCSKKIAQAKGLGKGWTILRKSSEKLKAPARGVGSKDRWLEIRQCFFVFGLEDHYVLYIIYLYGSKKYKFLSWKVCVICLLTFDLWKI